MSFLDTLIDWLNPIRIDETGKPLNYQLSEGLLLFYLAVASNFIGDLLSPTMQDLFTNNRLAKHLLGFVIMLYTVTFSAGVESLLSAFKFTLTLYLWFLLTTKLSLTWNLVIVGVLIIGFALEKYQKSLSGEPEKFLTNRKLTNTLFMSLMAITAAGGIYNFAVAQQQGGAEFSFLDYLLGA